MTGKNGAMWRELRSTTSSLQIGLEIGSNCQQRNECPYLFFFFFFFHLYWKFSTQIWRIASSHASIMVGCALSSPYGSRVLINFNRPSQLQLTRPIHVTICTPASIALHHHHYKRKWSKPTSSLLVWRNYSLLPRIL